MLHCNAVMKLTNEKKGIFSFYSHNMNKNFNEIISITVDLMFQLKVLTPCIKCVQYRGDSIINVGGYLEYCGGCSVPWGIS